MHDTASTPLPNRARASKACERLPQPMVEAGGTDFWRKRLCADGAVIAANRVGESVPAAALYRYFGLAVDNLVAAVPTVSSRESKS